jgi:hypothetical protein
MAVLPHCRRPVAVTGETVAPQGTAVKTTGILRHGVSPG